MLGSGAVIVMDETTCMVKVLERISEFYMMNLVDNVLLVEKEQVGWCVWLHRIEHGEGRMEDLDLLDSVAGKNIEGERFVRLVKQQHGQCRVLLKHFYR